jgi:hypothetical protein
VKLNFKDYSCIFLDEYENKISQHELEENAQILSVNEDKQELNVLIEDFSKQLTFTKTIMYN